LTNYNAEEAPLFVGLSVVPYVYYREAPTGPHAGKLLQPTSELPSRLPVEPSVQRLGSEGHASEASKAQKHNSNDPSPAHER
jgi:hypothetical protein